MHVCAAMCAQVVFTDSDGPGRYFSAWQRISYPHPVVLLHRSPFASGTCFRRVLHSPFVHAASVYSRLAAGWVQRGKHCTWAIDAFADAIMVQAPVCCACCQ